MIVLDAMGNIIYNNVKGEKQTKLSLHCENNHIKIHIHKANGWKGSEKNKNSSVCWSKGTVPLVAVMIMVCLGIWPAHQSFSHSIILGEGRDKNNTICCLPQSWHLGAPP